MFALRLAETTEFVWAATAAACAVSVSGDFYLMPPVNSLLSFKLKVVLRTLPLMDITKVMTWALHPTYVYVQYIP